MPAQTNRSLVDGLVVLQTLCAAGGPVGVRDMARRLGWHPVRTNRLLQSLVLAGMARQDPERRYLPGSGVHVLAAIATFGSGLLRRALPELQRLAQETKAVVALGVLWQDEVCYLYHGGPDLPAGEALGRAVLHPVADSSIGQVLRDGLAEAVLRHGSADQPHWSIAVPVGDPPHSGLACTAVPITTKPASILPRLRACAQRIADLENAP